MISQLSYRDNFKKTIRIAYPLMLSQLGHILVGVIDSMMVGQLGPEPLELRILPIAFSMSSSCLALAFLLALPLWWLRPMARLAN